MLTLDQKIEMFTLVSIYLKNAQESKKRGDREGFNFYHIKAQAAIDGIISGFFYSEDCISKQHWKKYRDRMKAAEEVQDYLSSIAFDD